MQQFPKIQRRFKKMPVFNIKLIKYNGIALVKINENKN